MLAFRTDRIRTGLEDKEFLYWQMESICRLADNTGLCLLADRRNAFCPGQVLWQNVGKVVLTGMLAVKQTENQCDRKLDRLVSGWMGRLAYSQSIRQGGGLSEGGCQLNRLSDRQVERLSCRQVKTLMDTQVAKLAAVSRQVYCTRWPVWGWVVHYNIYFSPVRQ